MLLTLNAQISYGSFEEIESIVDLSKELSDYFIDKEFGLIKNIYAGVICVSKQFEDFFVVRKPKLLRKEPSLVFEYKINYENFNSMNYFLQKKYIVTELYIQLKQFFTERKIKNFDENSFLNSLFFFINSNNLLLE